MTKPFYKNDLVSGIASYFWKYWGDQLKRLGIDWPGFEMCLSAWKEDFILWSRDKMKWKDIAEDIKKHIPRSKEWLDRKRGKVKGEGIFPLRK